MQSRSQYICLFARLLPTAAPFFEQIAGEIHEFKELFIKYSWFIHGFEWLKILIFIIYSWYSWFWVGKLLRSSLYMSFFYLRVL